jgi:hypothetical protein
VKSCRTDVLSGSETWKLSVEKKRGFKGNEVIFDIHMSVHRNIITNYSQQDATIFYLFIFTDALHVSGSFSPHHQEHVTVNTASGIVNQYCC